jgi:2-phosphosulfolactate phosphatase
MGTVPDCHRQSGHRVRFDWGPEGADAVGPGAAYVAVVDVLSFTTTLTVAVERGIAVLPYRWRDASAAEVARAHDATLAVGRSAAGPGAVSLSPATVLRSTGVRRLVLPSPNGSTVAARLAATGVTVVGVSLRNAAAAAAWVRRHAGDRPVAVVAAGERWADGPLRPAVEDLWGAGAFIAALGGHGASPEARAAAAAYRDVATDLPAALADCASGRELIGNGYPGDVAVAAAGADSAAVPVLSGGWFTDHAAGPPGVADRMSGAPRDTS